MVMLEDTAGWAQDLLHLSSRARFLGFLGVFRLGARLVFIDESLSCTDLLNSALDSADFRLQNDHALV